MIKQLKELCIKTEQGSNLSECLNKYTKTQIKNILDLYGVKVASAAKKQEMTDAAEAAIKENAAAYFESDEGRTQRPLIDAMIAAPLRLNSSEDFEKIKNIYDKGIVFLREDGEEAETLVPANIIAILDSVSAKEADGCGGGTLRKGSGNHPFCRGPGKHLRRLYDAAAERCLGLYSSERHRSGGTPGGSRKSRR